MSLDILVLCGSVAGVLVLLLPLKEIKSNSFGIAVTAMSVLITAYALKNAIPLFNYFNTFYDSEMAVCFKVLTKVLGITLICNITSDMASDLGMGSLAGKVEFAGRVAIILSAVPLLDTLLSQIESFI